MLAVAYATGRASHARQVKGSCSTGQSPQRAVVPVEEKKKKKLDYIFWMFARTPGLRPSCCLQLVKLTVSTGIRRNSLLLPVSANHSCIIRMQMQQFYNKPCWWCRHARLRRRNDLLVAVTSFPELARVFCYVPFLSIMEPVSRDLFRRVHKIAKSDY
jgi:hypothetical protein